MKRLVTFFALTALCAGFSLIGARGASAGGFLGGLLGSNCQTSGTQVFASWNDFRSYFLAPNGGLESGTNGWSLSGGASLANENEPFLPTGRHSLALPSGSKAMSPVLCLGPKNLSIRMFGKDDGGADTGLHVRVLWYGLLNTLLGATDFDTFSPGRGWAPTSSLSSVGGFNLLVPIVGSTSARLQLTRLGDDSAWLIDDVFVDPWASRCC